MKNAIFKISAILVAVMVLCIPPTAIFALMGDKEHALIFVVIIFSAVFIVLLLFALDMLVDEFKNEV